MAHQNGSEQTDAATNNSDGSESTDPGSDDSNISLDEALFDWASNTMPITGEDVEFLNVRKQAQSPSK